MKSKTYLNCRFSAAVWLLAVSASSFSALASAEMLLAQHRNGTQSAPEETPMPQDKAAITGVRFLSWKSYTRVMLELSQGATYDVRRLNEDAARSLPARVYIDIKGARIGAASRDPIPVDDGLLRQVRIGQYSQDVVRVVLDTNNLGSYNTFMLADPYRLVIDIYGGASMSNGAAKTDVMRRPDAHAPRTMR